MPRFDSIQAWLNEQAAHDDSDCAIAYRVTVLPDGGITDPGRCNVVGHTDTSVTVEHGHPDMPTEFFLDADDTDEALSAPRPEGGRSYLFAKDGDMSEFLGKHQLQKAIADNLADWAKDASVADMRAAISCLAVRIPKEILDHVTDAAASIASADAPGAPGAARDACYAMCVLFTPDLERVVMYEPACGKAKGLLGVPTRRIVPGEFPETAARRAAAAAIAQYSFTDTHEVMDIVLRDRSVPDDDPLRVYWPTCTFRVYAGIFDPGMPKRHEDRGGPRTWPVETVLTATNADKLFVLGKMFPCVIEESLRTVNRDLSRQRGYAAYRQKCLAGSWPDNRNEVEPQ